MHHLGKKIAAVGFLMFVALWVTGIVRGLGVPYPQPSPWELQVSSDFQQWRQGVNNMKQLGLAMMPLPLLLDQGEVDRIQVHEKTAQLAAGTTAFDDDMARIRAVLVTNAATVFNERNTGIVPERRLALEVGVDPEQFDALVEQLRQIAHVDAINVQQRDRTGEFRRLHAQRQSLKKHLEAVLKLRGLKAPSVDDELKIEQKIQDIEKELQSLNVQFGDMLGKESYYSVHLTLFEYQPGSRLDHTMTLPRRLAHAFLWALAWWLVAAVALGAVAGTYISLQTLWTRTSVPATPAVGPAATM